MGPGLLTREAETLKRELRDLIRVHRPELLAETGCGPLTAAILIGQTAGAARFKSDAHFARMAGVAPVPVEAMRCLKRHLARHYHQVLLRPAAQPMRPDPLPGGPPLHCLT